MLAVDIYHIGQLLNHKYSSLRISYIFLALAVLLGISLYSYALFNLPA